MRGLMLTEVVLLGFLVLLLLLAAPGCGDGDPVGLAGGPNVVEQVGEAIGKTVEAEGR